MNDLILVANLSMSLLTFALIARWYVVPALRRLPWERALQPLLLLHTFRHIGLMFLASGVVKTPLADAFAQPAAWGDLAAALLALLALFALRTGKGWAVGAVWVFNVEGTLDLLYAVGQGIAQHAAAGMGGAFWTPAVIVPALLVTHGLVFWLLVQRRSLIGEPLRAEAA